MLRIYLHALVAGFVLSSAIGVKCFAASLEDYLFFQGTAESAVAVLGSEASYLHLSDASIDSAGRRIIRLSPGPIGVVGVRQDSVVGIWDRAKREFAPLPPPAKLGVDDRIECENPMLKLPTGSLADFFGNALVSGTREVSASRNTQDCFTTANSGRYASSWTMRFESPRELVFRNGFSVEAIKVEVHRAPIFGYGGTGLWQTFWFARRIGLIQYLPGPMHERFGDAEALGSSGALSRIAPSSLTLFPFESSMDLSGNERRVLPTISVEATVIEYQNTADFPASPGGQFFYSPSPSEQAYVDSGSAGRFQRTGRSWQVGGSSPVCRFFGSVSPGPNSHFYTGQSGECAELKRIQQSPVPTDRQQWNSEGTAFYAISQYQTSVGERRCPLNTKPVYRAYNNAFKSDGVKNPWNSNHRFSPETSDIKALVRSYGWLDEGIAFCSL